MKVQKYQCHLLEKCVRLWHESTCGLEIVLSRLSFHFSVTFHFECLCVFTFQTIVREEYGDGGFLSTYGLTQVRYYSMPSFSSFHLEMLWGVRLLPPVNRITTSKTERGISTKTKICVGANIFHVGRQNQGYSCSNFFNPIDLLTSFHRRPAGCRWA